MTQRLNPQRVVVPVDDVQDRQQAIAIGTDLGRRLGLPVDIVKVVDPTAADTEQLLIDSSADAEVAGRIIRNHSVDRAVRELTRDRTNLMCLASSGHRSLSEALSGSTSASILHDTRVPLVVVGPDCGDEVAGKFLAIAIDETDASTAVIDPALDLAAALGLKPMIYEVLGEISESVFVDSRESSRVARVAADFTRPGLQIEYDVLHDRHVSRALVRLTADDDVAMIAFASHGLKPAERVFFPSVVHQVIRHAKCPVLLASRPSSTDHPDRGQGARVVVGIDGSHADHGPIVVGADEAVRRHARLEIVHAWSPSWTIVEGGLATGGDIDVDIRNAHEVMKTAVLKVKALAPDVEIIEWIVERSATDALIDAAWDADLIVVGERRYKPVERWMLGSTTEAIIHRSPVPVLVVPEWTETTIAASTDVSS